MSRSGSEYDFDSDEVSDEKIDPSGIDMEPVTHESIKKKWGLVNISKDVFEPKWVSVEDLEKEEE